MYVTSFTQKKYSDFGVIDREEREWYNHFLFMIYIFTKVMFILIRKERKEN
jgi:hypothetical protein